MTILLVDDHPAVLQFLKQLLERTGFTVLAAASAAEAMAFERQGHAIDLLLSDVQMPGTTGLELADALARLRPGLEVVLMSGYPASMNGDTRDPRWRFVEKPFTAAALVLAVQQMLAQP